jgi:hypothetical protein
MLLNPFLFFPPICATSSSVLSCPISCGPPLTTLTALPRRHSVEDNGKKYACDECGQVFKLLRLKGTKHAHGSHH